MAVAVPTGGPDASGAPEAPGAQQPQGTADAAQGAPGGAQASGQPDPSCASHGAGNPAFQPQPQGTADASPHPGPQDAAAARAFFPRGLAQPARGFRFSVDALLLADFASLRGVARVADLGCGCGVVGLALLLRAPDGPQEVIGLDSNPGMVACANENATRLGLGPRCRAVLADVAAVRGHPELAPESVDLVVCNPPYRQPGTGRRCPDPGRDAARFEAGATTADFAQAAAYLLKNRHRACFIGLAERLDALLADLAAARLTPKRLRLVHPRPGAPARLVLAEAMKNGGPGLAVEPPLFLE